MQFPWEQLSKACRENWKAEAGWEASDEQGESLLFCRANVAICSDLTGLLQSKCFKATRSLLPSTRAPSAVRTGQGAHRCLPQSAMSSPTQLAVPQRGSYLHGSLFTCFSHSVSCMHLQAHLRCTMLATPTPSTAHPAFPPPLCSGLTHNLAPGVSLCVQILYHRTHAHLLVN